MKGLSNDSGYNPYQGYDETNIQKENHKLMYGPEGDSSGKAAFATASEIEQIMQSSGVPASGHPFQYFFYLIRDVFMGKDLKAEETNINKFAKQLESLTALLNLWEGIKSQVYEASNGTDTTKKFIGLIGQLLNTIYGKVLEGRKFPTDGTPFTNGNFKSLLNTVDHLPSSLYAKYFPVLGGSAVSLLHSLATFSAYFSEPASGGKMPTLTGLWATIETGGTAGQGLPNPTAFDSYFDSLSEGSTTLSGVSTSESSKLQYSQSEYNRLNAFIHSMLKSWLSIRKEMVGHMTQARS